MVVSLRGKSWKLSWTTGLGAGSFSELEQLAAEGLDALLQRGQTPWPQAEGEGRDVAFGGGHGGHRALLIASLAGIGSGSGFGERNFGIGFGQIGVGVG